MLPGRIEAEGDGDGAIDGEGLALGAGVLDGRADADGFGVVDGAAIVAGATDAAGGGAGGVQSSGCTTVSPLAGSCSMIRTPESRAHAASVSSSTGVSVML